MKVEKFSIGFGPTLFGFRRGETEYVLAAIPLGGFVKMLGEGPEDEASKSTDPRAYPNKSVWARMAIISAGVIMNCSWRRCVSFMSMGTDAQDRPPVLGRSSPARRPMRRACAGRRDRGDRRPPRPRVYRPLAKSAAQLAGPGASPRGQAPGPRRS